MHYPLLGCYATPVRSRLIPALICVPAKAQPRFVFSPYTGPTGKRLRRTLGISILPQSTTVVAPVAAAVADPVAVVATVTAEPMVAASGFVADAPEPEANWDSPRVIMLFLLGGKAHVTLTDSETGASFAYTVKKASATYSRPDVRYFIDVVHNPDAGGRINDDQEFKARWSKVSQPATVLFATWYGAISEGHPARGISAKHHGRCGKCARTLTDVVSINSGIGPECHFRVFGVRRTAAKKVGAVRKVKATKAIIGAAIEPVEVDHLLQFNFGVLADAHIAYDAAKARSDLESITGRQVAIHRVREVINARNPSVAQLEAVAAAEYDIANVSRTPMPGGRVAAQVARHIRAGDEATCAAKRLQARQAVLAA